MNMYFAVLLVAVVALPASAHPGKTDRDGGHKCYKECAEWDLYYAEYHLHDKDGKAVKVAMKKPARPEPEAVPAGEKAVIGDQSSDRPVEATPAQPAALAAITPVEADTLSLPWILLMLFLLLLFAVRRRRRKASDAKQAVIS